MGYRLTDLAFGDLVDIHDYIAQDRPEAARRLLSTLRQICLLGEISRSRAMALEIPNHCSLTTNSREPSACARLGGLLTLAVS
jgi:hypothetical protein